MFKIFLFILFNIAFACDENNGRQPIVNTPLGKIRGSIMTSRLGKNIYSFRSIRYAKAPIGELRFQPPVPVEKWNDIYDATQAGPVCPQPNNQNSSEDCLVLNVYTNKLPSRNSAKKPVLIFFHPGGFFVYNGASYFHGPDYLLDEDIVLVTANYRLGSLGFIATGTKEAPGNNGFKDQVVVLKWIRDNIAAFGGDPNEVTLGGYSAGAFSTTLHMISPMSKDLFHKAIIMGGSGFTYAPISTNQIDLARRQARIVNCSDATPVDIINCLKTKSAQEIADALIPLQNEDEGSILLWTSVIEPDFGQERFLTEHPIATALKGDIMDVPAIIGITQNEFGYVSYSGFQSQEYLDRLSDDYLNLFPTILVYERNSTKSNEISRSLYRFYFGDGRVENTTEARLGYEHLIQDTIGFVVNRATKLIAEKTTANTYSYFFAYKGRYSAFYLPNSNNETVGPVHHDDLQYLFYMANMYPERINRGDPEWDTVTKMVKMWTDFVKTGNPTPEKSELLNDIKWISYNEPERKYLEIGDRMIMKENLREDRYREWEKLFPLSDYL